jgi:FdhD protein
MSGFIERNILRVNNGISVEEADMLTVEEPLEIRIIHSDIEYSVSVIMRTPVDDFALAAGFLFTEGIVKENSIKEIKYSNSAKLPERNNIVNVEVSDFERNLLGRRNFYVNSSCGVCGKTNIDDIFVKSGELIRSKKVLNYSGILEMPEIMKSSQKIFNSTGGIHAAAIIDFSGNVISMGEDIGRHNAVDKAIGKMVMNRNKRNPEAVLQVSGRAGFEILQKAAMFGIPVVSSVSAPSSLAVELADEFNITLLSFVRGNRFNIYTHGERIELKNSHSQATRN